MNTMLVILLTMAAAPAVEQSPAPTTRLYVRTLPPGATVTVDGQSVGKSDGLFLVPPGVRKVTVELDGHGTQTRQIEVRDGWIRRVEIQLNDQGDSSGSKDLWAGWTYHPPKAGTRSPDSQVARGDVSLDEPTPVSWVADDRIYLGYVDDTAENQQSIGGGGHAVRFRRPAESSKLVAVEVFAARYGTPQPPDEDFHVYVLDDHQKPIRDFRFPYKTLQRGELRWYTLPVEPSEVPETFSIALSFSPTETKGVFVGMDGDVQKTHSYVGLPTRGWSQEGKFDWMIHAVLTPVPKNIEIR